MYATLESIVRLPRIVIFKDFKTRQNATASFLGFDTESSSAGDLGRNPLHSVSIVFLRTKSIKCKLLALCRRKAKLFDGCFSTLSESCSWGLGWGRGFAPPRPTGKLRFQNKLRFSRAQQRFENLKIKYVKPSNTFADRNLQRKTGFGIYIDTEGLSKTLFYIHREVEALAHPPEFGETSFFY